MAQIYDVHAPPSGNAPEGHVLRTIEVRAMREASLPGVLTADVLAPEVTITVKWQASTDGVTWHDMKPIETVIRENVEQSSREADDARFATEIAAEVGSK